MANEDDKMHQTARYSQVFSLAREGYTEAFNMLRPCWPLDKLNYATFLARLSSASAFRMFELENRASSSS